MKKVEAVAVLPRTLGSAMSPTSMSVPVAVSVSQPAHRKTMRPAQRTETKLVQNSFQFPV